MNSPLSISCNVGGFKDVNATKEFQFRIFRPEMPSTAINIISTHEEGFTYAIYNPRVNSKDITLEHVSPNSVLFKIEKLQKDDEGDYECSVVNSETHYFGDYSAETTVKGRVNQSINIFRVLSAPFKCLYKYMHVL